MTLSLPGSDAPPSGYTKGTDGLWYKFYESLSYTKAEAQAHCAAEGATLPVILDADTNAAVGAVVKYGFIDAVLAKGRYGLAWMTENGVILNFLPWEVSEPSGFDGETCVQRLSTGEWNDVPCGGDAKAPFGCQWGREGEF